jgi:hypothetical protein
MIQVHLTGVDLVVIAVAILMVMVNVIPIVMVNAIRMHIRFSNRFICPCELAKNFSESLWLGFLLISVRD